MSVTIEEASPLSEVQRARVSEPAPTIPESSIDSSDYGENNSSGPTTAGSSQPSTPKPHPMAFTVDFGQAKDLDKARLEELAKKSQARHQRVQAMSTNVARVRPVAPKPPLSAKLPRKAQGYNSEGYFSSDQEDTNLSGSVKLRSSPLAQRMASPTNRHLRSPVNDFQPRHTSKSPIVDSIMSRSENFTSYPSRQRLNLPLNNSNGSYLKNVHRAPSFGNLTYHIRPMEHIIDNSPDGVMLTDISSPELDILTPDNGLSTPDEISPIRFRAASETPDLLNRKFCANVDDDIDRESNNSSTGTYTIEGDHYTEDQKARMSIDRDRILGAATMDSAIDATLRRRASRVRNPELAFVMPEEGARSHSNMHSNDQLNKTLATRLHSNYQFNKTSDTCLHSNDQLNKTFATRLHSNDQLNKTFDTHLQSNDELNKTFDTHLNSSDELNKTFGTPSKTNEKNILEISCCYESPTENDLAAQTSKQIKSTRSYLEKIKNRVKTITDKTFVKPQNSTKQLEKNMDVGSFTSVTTSGVLSSKSPVKIEIPQRRRCSLAKSEIDQTDYIHRLSRESSVPVCLPSNQLTLSGAKFESTALQSAQRALKDDGIQTDITGDQVVRKLSNLSLNRCKGDKTWIQDWAESVKKYNNNTLGGTPSETTFVMDNRPPISPRHHPNSRIPFDGSPSKIPSPVGTLLHRRTPDLIPTQDTESYLLKTQNAITNLQAKLHSNRSTSQSFSNIPPQLTSSLISEKTAVSRLPISQLSRSNSLNYRLRPKDNDGSPLKSPGHYIITGSTKIPESTKKLLNLESRSLDTNHRKDSNSNINSPISERGGLLSYSSDDKTLSNRPQYDVEAILSPHRKTHSRHRSFDGRQPQDYFSDCNNANQTVSLKTVLKNNALESQYPRIEPTVRCQDTSKKSPRLLSDGNKQFPRHANFGGAIKRSSSFNTVNKNNNYIEPFQVGLRNSAGNEFNNYLTDESDTEYEKAYVGHTPHRLPHRGRLESTDINSKQVPTNSRCPNTPEMQRKYGTGLVRSSVRVTNKERAGSARMSEPPVCREERSKSANPSRRISEPTRQTVFNRLTKSRSSTRDFQPKASDLGAKRPVQHRSSTALASKEIEFNNWKKRASYDPMKAAQEGRKKQQINKRNECNKDDLSSPSHSSPVHRSQSFHATNMADLALDYSSSETEDLTPVDPLVTSTHSDILDLMPKKRFEERPRNVKRQGLNNKVVLSKDFSTNFQVNQQPQKLKCRDADKRKTFIIDDTTPTRDNVDFLAKRDDTADKRKTFILDSDTNFTTNGSSPRTSSIFSHEKTSLTTYTSDTEGESGTESAPVVVLRHAQGKRAGSAPVRQRYSGDYSMSSSTTSVTQNTKKGKEKEIQPRYLDISKYKSDTSPKNFLKRDPSKTYVGVLNTGDKHPHKGSAQHYEMEQKKQELEKWKRRASYDPRKSAALGKSKASPKTASSVLRSQSFHGPMLQSPSMRLRTPPADYGFLETYDASSDNDF